jgi:putative transcriptional regulator
MASMESLRGQLLIASPVIVDPNFRRTVVLIAEHSEEGAMGVVLNRPSEAKVEEAATPLDALVGPGEPIYAGGPVEPAAVVVLAEFDDPEDAATIVVDRVGFMRSDASVEDVNAHTSRARVFAGYAGWGGGQLEAELEGEAWFVEPATPDVVFSTDPNDLWSGLLRRRGGEFTLIATMPPDPSLN